jgi:predicted RNase H-like HicB family nuclease
MFSNPSQVIVLSEDYHRSSLHGLSAHHRDLPEVHGAGSSPKDAAARLAELLLLTLDDAPSDWRRQIIQQAIEDVRAFAERDCS